MKILLSLCIIPALLTGMTSCAGFGPTHVAICKDGSCIDFTIPEIPAKTSGKDAKEVQPVQ